MNPSVDVILRLRPLDRANPKVLTYTFIGVLIRQNMENIGNAERIIVHPFGGNSMLDLAV